MEGCQIRTIELHRFDRELSEARYHLDNRSCMCGLLSVTASNGSCGCSEFAVPSTQLRGDFIQWAVVFQRLKGMTIQEGLDFIHLHQDTWGAARVCLAEAVLTHMEQTGAAWNRTYLFDHTEAYVSF
ncbi:hypothetical protein A8990_14818 [Paenibacillus taihuensis]|uniref:Uncharacterized protein n=1 Tax=Paenibacillus taihuensis TaxID=1156355 RepID=A0A3D9R0B8_9BACL|nr:hypothetical protein [Paenibacillus taihuensis]REE66682.1 hypothetical protein A8990_14818 [Paenibacillus taihuensis]